MGRIRGLLGEARLERIVRIPGVEGDHVEAALRQAGGKPRDRTAHDVHAAVPEQDEQLREQRLDALAHVLHVHERHLRQRDQRRQGRALGLVEDRVALGDEHSAQPLAPAEGVHHQHSAVVLQLKARPPAPAKHAPRLLSDRLRQRAGAAPWPHDGNEVSVEDRDLRAKKARSTLDRIRKPSGPDRRAGDRRLGAQGPLQPGAGRRLLAIGDPPSDRDERRAVGDLQQRQPDALARGDELGRSTGAEHLGPEAHRRDPRAREASDERLVLRRAPVVGELPTGRQQQLAGFGERRRVLQIGRMGP